MYQREYLFYNNREQLYTSAKIIYQEIKKYLPPIYSLIDVGCGLAAFSKVFQDNGAKEIKIIDHPRLDVSECLIKENFEFISCDLDTALPKPLKADLTICTEVLEHLNLKRSLEVLNFITQSADIIIFSAAVPKQGGVGHINEQRHKFWIERFRERGFDYSDLFKANIINNNDVLFWLRTNIFIFHRNQKADSPLKNSKWISEDFEIVYNHTLTESYTLPELFKFFPKVLSTSLKYHLRIKN